MPTPKLTEKDFTDTLLAIEDHGSHAKAAEALGLSIPGIRSRLQRGRKLYGEKLSKKHLGLPDNYVAGKITVATRPDGSITQAWTRGTPNVSPKEVAAIYAKALRNLPRAKPTAAPDIPKKNGLAVFPACDWHFGALVPESVTGNQYDRDVALRRLREGFETTFAAIPASENAIILWNGDTTHADNDKAVTPKSGHRLQVEGSHHENIGLVIKAAVWQIDLALTRHANVEFVATKGNHDLSTPTPLMYALRERYRDEPRVTINADAAGDFWTYQKHGLFLVAHHGHGLKPERLASEIKFKFRRDFGVSDHHYFFTSHLHHEKSDTFGGLRWLQLPALGMLDQHGAEMGFSDTGGMAAFHFDTKRGTFQHFAVRLSK